MTYTRADAEQFADGQAWADHPIRQTVIDWMLHPNPHPHELNTCPVCHTVTERRRYSVAPSAVPCRDVCRQRHSAGRHVVPPAFPRITRYGDEPTLEKGPRI